MTEVTLDHLRPSPDWKKEMDELRLAKDSEGIMRKGLRKLAERRKRLAEKYRLLQEVADLFQAELAPS